MRVHTQFSCRKQQGFTLVELSIVLVIIGLLVGGVLTGRDLIKQAENRSAISLINRIVSAYRIFQSKYNCIVGDCPNATSIFGTYSTYGSCTTMTNGNGNGNGNGVIDFGGAAWWQCENVMAIKTLELSGLLPSAITSPCLNNIVVMNGINDKCAYFYNDDLYNQVTARDANTITFGDLTTSSSLAAPVISPTQAQQIDSKMDDGIATQGQFVGLDSGAKSGGAIIAGSCVTSGSYNISDVQSCRVMYYLK